MSGPLFSVVIPWHGNMDHLVRALASVNAQSFDDYEIVVAANGPGVAKMAEAARLPEAKRCRFVSTEQGDASRARNAGADAAKGEFIAFLDVDDRFLEHKLAAIAEAISTQGADLVWTRGYRVRTGTERAIYPPELFASGDDIGEFFFSRGANFSGSAIVVRRSYATKVRFADDLKTYEDNDFAIRIVDAGAKPFMLPEPHYEWYDEVDVGRLSSNKDFDKHLAWAKSLRSVMTEKAFFGFQARRVGQHVFPRQFLFGLTAMFQGWRRGGISLGESAQFLARGLLPQPLVRWIITRRAMRKSKALGL